MHDQTSRYFAATQYACGVLGDNASRYFPRLHQLSQYNSLDELQAIIASWRPVTPPPPPAPNLWVPGSQWGGAIRVEHDKGIFWKLKCACGKNFELSTNDTIPDDRRKCDTCLLAEDLSESKKEIIAKLERTSTVILAWHRAHDKLVWSRVHKALTKRNTKNADLARELHALVWVKISEHAGDYRDQGFKVSAWLGKVADNTLKDHFKVTGNRERLAPMTPMIEGDKNRQAAAPPTKPEESLPSKSISPDGSAPNGENLAGAAWDRAQNWNR